MSSGRSAASMGVRLLVLLCQIAEKTRERVACGPASLAPYPDLAPRTQRTPSGVRSPRRAARDRRWRDPQLQTAPCLPPLVVVDLSTSVWPAGGRPWRTHHPMALSARSAISA